VYFGKKSSAVKSYDRPLFLAGSLLVPAKSYTYLGLVMQQSGRWTEHYERIRSKAAKLSQLINRVNQRYSNPSPTIIRQLVMAMPRAAVMWALPFWQPTESQYHQLDSILVKPLRCALCLPSCTSIAAVLCEYGMADIRDTRERQILEYISRLHRSEVVNHPARDLIATTQLLQSSSSVVIGIQDLQFWKELRAIESRWQVSVSDPGDAQVFKRLMVSRYLQRYQESKPSTFPPRPGLRSVKLRPGVSHYLYHDTKSAAVLRARLRFDLNGLQMGVVATRVATQKDRSDPVVQAELHNQRRCQLCGCDDADSRRHLLANCPALDAARDRLEFALQAEAMERSGRLRLHSYECLIAESLEHFMLGELNCAKAVQDLGLSFTDDHAHVLHTVSASDDLLSGSPPRTRPRRHHHDVREKILPTKCPCKHPTLPIKTRLGASAAFIQELFRARFPGTITCVTASST
jgi:hypothetical protein